MEGEERRGEGPHAWWPRLEKCARLMTNESVASRCLLPNVKVYSSAFTFVPLDCRSLTAACGEMTRKKEEGRRDVSTSANGQQAGRRAEVDGHTHLDGVLREHAAVELDRGQAQVLGDVRVLDLHDLIQRLPFHPAQVAVVSNRTATSASSSGARASLVGGGGRDAHAGDLLTTLLPGCCSRWPSRTRRF